MKTLLAVAAVALLAGCAAHTTCVQPDPVEPSHPKVWNKGVNGGKEIVPANGTTVK
jgi:type IV pilus biogenesis protein CpaD/CtpE